MTDQQIIDNVLGGRTDQFALIIRQYGTNVRLFVSRTIHGNEDAEELTQDVFVKAFQRLDSYQAEKGSLLNWLLGIAWKEVLMFLRKSQPVITDLESDAESLFVSDEETDRMLAEQEEQHVKALHEAVATLKPEDQMLLHLYYTEDLPLKEIAEIVGHDSLYLATRLQRIRKKLCAIIKEERR
jgi:RNA polymerase sigma-70 factor (ECF subfamily)